MLGLVMKLVLSGMASRSPVLGAGKMTIRVSVEYPTPMACRRWYLLYISTYIQYHTQKQNTLYLTSLQCVWGGLMLDYRYYK